MDPTRKSPPRPAETELEIKRILLLDDDIDLADALKGLLESRNYIVTTVKNGAEGLREIMALDFDVIMCDMVMPSMAGDMFFLAVQKTKPHLCDRFVFLTGHSDIPRVTEFIQRVNGVVLYKPVSSKELVRTISFVTNRKPHEEATAVEE
jgi:DNA-binding NtrC family response regulator